ncbi:MAG TPA: peptide chain release factor N(5)-glutamine methyltransferase [Vicinamibacterales bacterium]|nr:peptide chain release factor N(5)-glutamine methyltransferase [Vicinamibacterales bacterium]
MHALADLVRQAADRLRGQLSPEQNAALDAEVLARHVLGWDRARWLADAREPAPAGFAARFDALVSRRAAGEPVAYITGTREFWGLDFEVSPAVLVPRPETEVLVEEALKLIDARPGGIARVADVGTGSGCIAVALAHSRPGVTVVATDVSEEALAVARRNASRHGVGGRVEFLLASGLEGVGPVDLVVSNPPYIGTGDADGVTADVRRHEPHVALFSGADGLDVIRALLASVRERTPPPPLLFEFGGSEAPVRAAIEASGLRLAAVTPDLAGLPRVARVEA